MTTAAKTIITLLSLVTVVAIIAGVYIHVIKGRSFSVSTKTVEDKETFKDEMNNLSINLDAADLMIQSGDELSVSYSMPESMVPKISFRNGTLSIESPKGFVSLPIAGKLDHYVIVTIPPESDLRSVSVDLDAGNMKLEDFTTGSLDISIDAGNSDLTDVSASSASIRGDAGNVKLKNCSMDNFKVSVDAGNLDIDDSSVSVIDARSDAGNIESHNSTIDAGRCRTDLGNINLSGDIGDVDVKTDLGRATVNGAK